MHLESLPPHSFYFHSFNAIFLLLLICVDLSCGPKFCHRLTVIAVERFFFLKKGHLNGCTFWLQNLFNLQCHQSGIIHHVGGLQPVGQHSKGAISLDETPHHADLLWSEELQRECLTWHQHHSRMWQDRDGLTAVIIVNCTAMKLFHVWTQVLPSKWPVSIHL